MFKKVNEKIKSKIKRNLFKIIRNSKSSDIEAGITMIALAIAIIILLILSGITISSLTGDNGLIGKTGKAKKQIEI